MKILPQRKTSFEYTKIFTDTEAFNELKEIKESGAVLDPLLARQLECYTMLTSETRSTPHLLQRNSAWKPDQ